MASEIRNHDAYEQGTRRRIIDNAMKTFQKLPDAPVAIDWILSAMSYGNEFAISLFDAYNRYGKLTEGQLAAVMKIVKRNEEKQAELNAKIADDNSKSEFVGVLKGRQDFELTIVAVIELEPYQVAYNTWTCNTLFSMVDANENKIVYIGTADLGSKGDTVNLKATVKEHTVYRGAKQTKINRPTIKKES